MSAQYIADPILTIYKGSNETGTAYNYNQYDQVSPATLSVENIPSGWNDQIQSLTYNDFGTLLMYPNANYGGKPLALKGPGSWDMGSYPGYNKSITTFKATQLTQPIGTYIKCCAGSNTGCGMYNKESSATCSNIMSSSCNNPQNLSMPECQNWCLANPGKCDSGAAAFCAIPANANSSFCGCLNSKINTSAQFANSSPACVDSNCMKGGYMNSNMYNSSKSCPSTITCDVYNDGLTAGVAINPSYTSLNCGNSASTPSSSSSAYTTPEIVIFVLVVLLGLVAFIIKNNESHRFVVRR